VAGFASVTAAAVTAAIAAAVAASVAITVSVIIYWWGINAVLEIAGYWVTIVLLTKLQGYLRL
jgi:hypothetical protein